MIAPLLAATTAVQAPIGETGLIAGLLDRQKIGTGFGTQEYDEPPER